MTDNEDNELVMGDRVAERVKVGSEYRATRTGVVRAILRESSVIHRPACLVEFDDGDDRERWMEQWEVLKQ